MAQFESKHWHDVDSNSTVASLKSHADRGLSSADAAERLETYGQNVLTRKKGEGPVIRFLRQFHQPLIYILIAAGCVTLALAEWIDSSVIFAVVLLNAVVGFIQEAKALKAMEALEKTMTAECTVVRDGEARRLDSRQIVQGDIVLLASGDKVPADLRLVRSRDLQVDESALTGESVPVEKSVETLPSSTSLADCRNLAFASTLVTYGQARGIVVATGDDTEVGRISQLMTQADELKTPLTNKIAHFSHILLYVILALAAATFMIGIARDEPAADMFMAAVALAVGAIPEGLPAAVTIILAIGVSRMAKRRAIIRKLPAVETLGSTTVICTDKTGTLTQNQMTVRAVHDGCCRYLVTGGGYEPVGCIETADGATADTSRSATLTECLRCGLLCNDSLLVEKDGRWFTEGDPTEGALIAAAHKIGLSKEVEDQNLPRIETIAFESQHQYMATLHDAGDDKPRVVYMKGAVEVLLDRCERVMSPDGAEDGSPACALDKPAILKLTDELANTGLRVLAFARRELAPGTNELEHHDVASGMTFLGLQAMIDPPRAEAIEAVRQCKAAGISVKMITGDHVATAEAIAREIGIVHEGHDAGERQAAYSGRQLAELNDEQLVDAAEHAGVFARVTPEQKLRLVKALQTRGHIAAMTGDGVNDAPALKQANIGVAMGLSGTEVAKEAADMVLTDDNFATIKAAVEEGRGVFANLTKFIVWTLPTNAGEGLVILTSVCTGAMLPLLPLHILWINMTTAVLLGMMLAFEPREAGIMQQPPRDPRSPLLNFDLIMRIGLVSLLMLAGAFGLFTWERFAGADIETARTVAVNAFVTIEAFYLLNCRSLTRSMFKIGLFSNRWLLLGIAAMAVLQLLFTYLPVMNTLLQTAPISAAAWGRIVAVGFAVYCIVGFEKMIRRRLGQIK